MAGVTAACVLGIAAVVAETAPPPREIAFTTTRFTHPSLDIAPGGQHLALAVLGDLHLVDRRTGQVRPLTRGPAFDWAPRFSPDGRRLAFLSDGTDGLEDLYVLELEAATTTGSRVTKRLTRGIDTEGPPVWEPDGVSLLVERRNSHRPGRAWREIWRVRLDGSEERVTPVGEPWREPFVLPDGRIGAIRSLAGGRQSLFGLWTAERHDTLAVVAGEARRPRATGDTLVFRLHESGRSTLVAMTINHPALEPLIELEVFDEPHHPPTHAVTGDTVLCGTGGRIVAVHPGGTDTLDLAVPIRARVPARVTTGRRLQLPWETGATIGLVGLHGATLDRGGRRLVLSAAGELWMSEEAQPFARLTRTPVFELEPVLSPAGDEVVYTSFRSGRATLFRRRLDRGRGSALPGARSAYAPEWSADGRFILFASWEDFRGSLKRLPLAPGATTTTLARLGGVLHPAPSMPLGDRGVFFNLRQAGVHQLVHVDGAGPPRPLSDPARPLERARISPDGRWCAFRQRGRVSLAPVKGGRPVLAEVVRLAPGEAPRFSGEHLTFLTGDTLVTVTLPGTQADDPITASRSPSPPMNRRWLDLSLPAPAPPPPLLIEHLRLWDGTGAPTRREQSVLIRGGRIERVGRSASDWPERHDPEVRRVDALGAHAIPGLIDLHVHLSATPPEALLAFGVTAIRDLGSDAAFVRGVHEAIETEVVTGPHLFFAGEIFEGERPFWGDSFLAVGGAAEIDERLERLERYGADWIKIYPTLPRSLANEVIAGARARGMPVTAHAGGLRDAVVAILDGAVGIEHALTGESHADLHTLIARAGTAWVPTVCAAGWAARMAAAHPEKLRGRRVAATVPAARLEHLRRRTSLGGEGAGHEIDRRLSPVLAAIGDAHRSGARLLAGTDAGYPGVFHGLSLHWELAALVAAGVPPAAALESATRLAAEELGVGADLGTIEPGKIADLLLLDEDPLAEITATESILKVVSRGRLLETFELIGSLEEREP